MQRRSAVYAYGDIYTSRARDYAIFNHLYMYALKVFLLLPKPRAAPLGKHHASLVASRCVNVCTYLRAEGEEAITSKRSACSRLIRLQSMNDYLYICPQSTKEPSISDTPKINKFSAHAVCIHACTYAYKSLLARALFFPRTATCCALFVLVFSRARAGESGSERERGREK